MKKPIITSIVIMLAVLLMALAASCAKYDGERLFPTPKGYKERDYQLIRAFLEQEDAAGVKNGSKINPDYDPDVPETWRSKDAGEGEPAGISFEKRLFRKAVSEIALIPAEGVSFTGAVDASGLTSLRRFVSVNNDLTRVDLTGCKRLTELRIIDSGAKTLAVFDCKELDLVEITGNRLTELAFGRTPRMKFADIYAISGGTIGYTQNAGGATLFAVPDEGRDFSGWYTSKAELISHERTLDASSLGELIVSARFRTPGPDSPSVSADYDKDSGKPMLTWEKVPGTAYYSVARSVFKYSEYKTLGISTGDSYIDKTAQPGETYYYHVTAVNALGHSEPSFPRDCLCRLARPEFKCKHVASSGQNKLTWDAVPGAIGYEIYKSMERNGDFVLITTTEGKSFIDQDSEAGMTYYYKMKALGVERKIDSAKSPARGLTCDLPRPAVVISVDSVKGETALSWEDVPGAVSYEVFRTDDKDGEYVSVGSTEDTSWSEPLPDQGVSYWYRVTALSSDPASDSAMSKPVSTSAEDAAGDEG